MITDKLENINIYTNIPKVAGDFIKSLTNEVECGRVVLSDDIYANIEIYNTKSEQEAKFEAHEAYIDIQLLLSGNENIFYTDKTSLTAAQPYNKEKDIIFYKENVSDYPKLTLTGDNFIVLYPHEAHAPQVLANQKSEPVKKVVVKIKA